jgi:hypothetical protein
MTTVEPPAGPLMLPRQPLNLPAGSVRASLVLLILLPFWALLAVGEQRLIPMPLYLYFLLGLVLVFFASHGASIGPRHVSYHPSPWYLPRGFFRIAIVVITAGLLGYRYYKDPANFADYLTPDPDKVQHQWLPLLLSVGIGYITGWIVSGLLGSLRNSPVYQDLQAAVSIIAMVGLSGVAIVHLFINPTLQVPVDPLIAECIMTGITAWYFGARS